MKLIIKNFKWWFRLGLVTYPITGIVILIFQYFGLEEITIYKNFNTGLIYYIPFQGIIPFIIGILLHICIFLLFSFMLNIFRIPMSFIGNIKLVNYFRQLSKGAFRLNLVLSIVLSLILGLYFAIGFHDDFGIPSGFILVLPVYWISVWLVLWIREGFKENG